MSQDIPLDDDPAPRRDLLAAALASAIVDVEGIWCPISEGWFRQMPSKNLAGEDAYSCWKERLYLLEIPQGCKQVTHNHIVLMQNSEQKKLTDLGRLYISLYNFVVPLLYHTCF